jgi:hypothetical protein
MGKKLTEKTNWQKKKQKKETDSSVLLFSLTGLQSCEEWL